MGSSTNNLPRRAFFSYFKYKIGFHTFSLFDIQDGILRGINFIYNLLSLLLLKEIQKIKLLKKDNLSYIYYFIIFFIKFFRNGDYRRNLILKEIDPRIHFAISYLNPSSPNIKVYNGTFFY